MSEVRAFRRECLEPDWLKVFGKDLGIGREEDFRYYAKAHQAGATHAECMEAARRGPFVSVYVVLRRGGIGHTEDMEVMCLSAPVQAYLAASEAGVTHAECMEAAHIPGMVHDSNVFRDSNSFGVRNC